LYGAAYFLRLSLEFVTPANAGLVSGSYDASRHTNNDKEVVMADLEKDL
jgi:hypothetical protein